PVRLLMLLGLIHGALSHGRNEQLLGIVGALILAEPIGAALGRGPAVVLGPIWRRFSVGTALIAGAAGVLRRALPLSPERTGATFADLIGGLPQAIRAQPVLNEYGLGGQLMFQGVRPFIDSRADLHGDEFLTRYRRITGPDRAALELALSEFAIGWTIF